MPILLCALLIFSSPVVYSADTIYSAHCPVGCPENPAGNNLVFGHLYALSNNGNSKMADWVAYEVDVANFGESPGRDWVK